MPEAAPAVDATALLAAARRDLARLPTVLGALLDGLDAETARGRPAPEEWAPVEIVCHLRDEETEDFGARIRVILDGGAAFGRIDPPAWAVQRRYREADLRAALGVLLARRQESLALLDGLDPERLRPAVTLGRLGPLSGLDLLAAWAAHDLLHVQQLAATLARLWAERWAGLRVAYAGDIPYPAPAAGGG